MTLVSKYQASFATGEISPFLYGRSDINNYKNALLTCVNYIPMIYGGVTKRPGFKYITALADQAATGRLKKFVFSTSQSYQIEFTDNKIRFFTAQGLINQSRTIANGTFSDLTGWTDASTGGGSVAATGGKLALTAGGGTAIARAAAVSNFGIAQYDVTCDVTTANTTWKVGTTLGASDIGTGTVNIGVGSTFSFTPTVNGNMFLTFENTSDSEIDNIVISTEPYTIDSPYDIADVPDLRFTQSFDTLVIVHEDYEPRKLSRLGNDEWTLEVIEFDEPAYLDENNTTVTLTPSGTTGSITVTASSATFASTDVGRAIRYKAGPDQSDTIKYGGTTVPLNGTQTNFNIPFYPTDCEVYIIDDTGDYTLQVLATDYTIVGQQVVFGTPPGVTDQVEIRRPNAGSGEWGWMTITNFSTSTSVTATVERTLAGTNASTYWRLGAWSDTTGYPRLCTFHQQRLIFSKNRTMWLSGIGDIYNFSPDNSSHKGQIDSDTGFYFDLDKTSEINWMRSIKDSLVIGCLDNVQSVNSINEGIAGVAAKIESSVSCAFVEPETIGNEIIFIELGGKKVNAVGFDFSKDGYIPTDIALLAEHMSGDSTFVELAYQELPGKVLWIRRADGVLKSCTYVKDQEQISWSNHTIGGTAVEIESISVIPGASYSELWAVIKRTINSGTKRYVECMQKFFNGDDKEDAFFVDSGLTYSGSSTATISGLDHLEGQTVYINVEGAAHPTRVVSSGSITLEDETTKCHVGLYQPAILEPIEQDGGDDRNSLQATPTRTYAVGIRFHESLSCNIGYDSTSVREVLFRNVNDYYGQGPELKTGFQVEPINSGYQLNYKCYLTSTDPLPSTILSLVFKATAKVKQ